MKRRTSSAILAAYAAGMAIIALLAVILLRELLTPSGAITVSMAPLAMLIVNLLILAMLGWRIRVHLRARSAAASTVVEGESRP